MTDLWKDDADLFAQARPARPEPTPAAPASGEKPADPEKEKARDRKPDEKPAPPEKPPSVTHHEIKVDGKPLRYTATAGYLPRKQIAMRRSSVESRFATRRPRATCR